MEQTVDEMPETHNCVIKLRVNPKRQKEKVVIGCGAGFGGDRPTAALKLLQRVNRLDYLVLECLAERTLADRFHALMSRGKGYDPRISEWMQLLLPLAMERGVCIITNMGAKDPYGAQEEVLQIATKLGLNIRVGLAYQSSVSEIAQDNHLKCDDGDISVYMGAAPIVECLERYRPNVIITSRVADAALFLAPMVFELGWNWDEFQLLAQGSLAGHLLECGCQVTGGYYMHPGDKHRNMSFQNLLDVSLPFAEVSFDGMVYLAKPEGTGGVLNFSTCAEQLLYEIGDPSAYITPDVIIDIQDVTFQPLSKRKILCVGAKPAPNSVPQKLLLLRSMDSGWKGWGEISYGGYKSAERAQAAEVLVRAWIEESHPGIGNSIISYIIGLDSLKATCVVDGSRGNEDIRLRMDGLFEQEDHAVQFTREFTALYTNGPAGGGGISTGYKKEISLDKELVEREHVNWQISVSGENTSFDVNTSNLISRHFYTSVGPDLESNEESVALEIQAAPSGKRIPLYDVAHSRAGDKGNDVNFSIIPHYPPDIERLKTIITQDWVKGVVSNLLNQSSYPNTEDIERRNKWVSENVTVEVYEVRGIHALNVVVRNILDGGVNISRRIDRHGKTISDVILCQHVLLPP